MPPGSPKSSSCATFTLNSHGGRAATGTKALCLSAQGCFGSVQLCNSVDCGLPGFSVMEGFSTQEYWSVLARAGCHILLEHDIPCCPSRQLPSTWCCQDPCDPCTTSTCGPHRGKPKSSRAASGVNPSGQPISRGGNKTTIETQGQCG